MGEYLMKKSLVVLFAFICLASVLQAERLELTTEKFFAWCNEHGIPGYSLMAGSLDSEDEDGQLTMSGEFNASSGEMKIMTVDVDHISIMDEHDPDKPDAAIKIVKKLEVGGRKAIYIELKDIDANSMVVALPEVKGAVSVLSRPSISEEQFINIMTSLNFQAMIK